ncbi:MULTISPECIES: hypothetical protein [unclassified Roseitalea]|uniref:hypothetical protein n=1 Tax=unclassified Roseitalea TaxID=2639107 RepID=UPI00273FE19F|nr:MULTISPECIES: hypothetical protein [unclassified Roseitalea]
MKNFVSTRLRLVISAVSIIVMIAKSGAAAQPKYDRALALAVADRVGAQMGAMRGGFALDQEPVFVPDPVTTRSVPAHGRLPELLPRVAPFSGPAKLLMRERPYEPSKRPVRVVFVGSV